MPVTGRTGPTRTISRLVLTLPGLTRICLRGQPILEARDSLCGNLGGQKVRSRSWGGERRRIIAESGGKTPRTNPEDSCGPRDRGDP
ncbi:hypothetical protein NDU88_005284 [Pleurodeles waltl]|uniref:Uncharacterized protein n=1 Tax=Pleurodeles waltl TaxID=8319 RepID=A0AAV7TV03_PLEWA|nr:hypothetical protein NDU88_005284 [Pleurodeles waltl]